jgi:hypothetical protein
MVVRGPAEAGPAGTSVMPAAAGGPPAPAKWSARAQVRPPEHDGGDGDDGWDDGGWDSGEGDWDGSQPGRRRNLLAPTLIGLLTLLLLAILAFGIWLLVHGQQGGAAAPSSTPTATPTPAMTTSGPATTSAAPPTSQPPPPPTSVQIPVVGGQGLDFNAASARLVGLGFAVVRAERASATVPAGQVIDTNPPGGSVVPPGATVTVFVSTGAPTPTPTPTPSRTASPRPTPSRTH